VVVFEISCTSDEKLSDEYCHLVTLPVLPPKVKPVLFVPVHTVAPPDILPPTDVGLTVTVAELEFALEHAPLVTTAL